MDAKSYLMVDPREYDVEKHQRVIPGGEASLHFEAFPRYGFRRRFFVTSRGYLAFRPFDMRRMMSYASFWGQRRPSY